MTTILCAGCWDQRQFEDTSMVLSTGIDIAQEGEGYQYTFAFG
ncbi:MAG: hypothetical protein U0M15_05400 [Bacillota bacterium]|nr:hypothetical protein [Bacillota bacterium]